MVDISTLSTQQLCEWLIDKKLEIVSEQCKQNHIDGDILMNKLSQGDIEQLIPQMGLRIESASEVSLRRIIYCVVKSNLRFLHPPTP